MNLQKMSVLLMELGLLGSVLCGKPTNRTIMPTKEEQVNILNSVQEVFESVKLLVDEEGVATDEAVNKDVGRLVNLAKDILTLISESISVKMSCDSNNIYMLDKKHSIQQVTISSQKELETCTVEALEQITKNSKLLNSVAESATAEGQTFLDALAACSKKSSFSLVPCYRSVTMTDVLPLKLTLLKAMEEHKSGHSRAIIVRNNAIDCVEDIISRHRGKINEILGQEL